VENGGVEALSIGSRGARRPDIIWKGHQHRAIPPVGRTLFRDIRDPDPLSGSRYRVHFIIHFSGTILRRKSLESGGGHLWGNRQMPGKEYLSRQAKTLMKFAQTTSDPQVVARLVDKVTELKSKADGAPAKSPKAPDVEPPRRE
jgi:hypothetical protein